MTVITHKQAKSYLRAAADGLLRADQRTLLDAHLLECDSCRTEADELSTLEVRLKKNFQARWDANDGPSRNVMTNIHSRSRRIIMSNRINIGLRMLAGVTALIILGFAINYVILQLRNTSVAVNGTPTVGDAMSTANRLIVFALEKDGNIDIYTMYADGSKLSNLTNNPAQDNTPVWSPDGKRIAFISDRNGNPDIFVMNADGSNLIQLTDNPGDDGSFSWSPDGQKIIYSSSVGNDPNTNSYGLFIINADGENNSSPTEEIGSGNFLGWSPDSQTIVYEKQHPDIPVDDAGIYIENVDGSNPHVWLTNNNTAMGQVHWVDSQHFYAVGLNNTSYDYSLWSIYRFNTNGEIPQIIASHNATTAPISAIFDKTYVVESGGALRWYPLNESRTSLATWDFSDKCEKIDYSDSVVIQDTSHVISPDGEKAFVTIHCDEGVTWFYLENADGSEFRQLTDFSVTDSRWASGNWSPDGKYVTVTIGSMEGDSVNIYLFDIEKMINDPSTKPIQLTTPGTFKSQAVWQPVMNNDIVEEQKTPVPSSQTNKLIAFTSEKDGNLDIYTMQADGSDLTNLTNHSADDVSPVWSPDGKRIAFESDRDGYRQIYLMNADGSNVIQLTDDKADHWIGEPYNLSLNLWSPDGKRIIFSQTSIGEDNGMLYIIDANGENRKPLINEAGKYSFPSWSPDGKHIAFIVAENSVARIYSTDADGNNLINVTKALPSDETLEPWNYSWSRDAQSISFIASNWNYSIFSSSEGFPNYQWKAYEASLDGNTLVTNATARSQIGGYWDGTYFLSGSALVSSSPAFTWVEPKGKTTVVNPLKDCKQLLDNNTGGYASGYSSYKQSSNGNLVIGAYCPNGDKWLFWANSKGTFRPLLNSPIHVEGNTSNAMYLWAPSDFSWSPDDKYLAFNIFSLGKTDMYIVNVAEALKDPSIQPLKITIGNGSLYYSPVWHPFIP